MRNLAGIEEATTGSSILDFVMLFCSQYDRFLGRQFFNNFLKREINCGCEDYGSSSIVPTEF
jgi:hypothetical protein